MFMNYLRNKSFIGNLNIKLFYVRILYKSMQKFITVLDTLNYCLEHISIKNYKYFKLVYFRNNFCFVKYVFKFENYF